MLRKGDHVWIDSSIGIPIGARVKITDTGQWHLLDDEGIEHVLSEHELTTVRAMHPTSVEGVDDMIRLGDLSEAGMLRNLLIRHKQGIIYTYTGSVLVAVNPYQLLPIYTAEQVHLYHGRQLGELPPHVFAVADSCYFNMRRNQRNQCCIISGESGAGKTESTKLILQFLAAVSGQHSWIEQQILQANPILEAFGNAKTVMNDNSSRFGKYVEIFFNKEGIIERANMEQYLLEKSRVCHQAPNERNYHIFYCLLAGMPAEQKKILSLGDPGDFKYLTKGECIVCHGMDDADEYGRIRAALKILTFKEKDCWEIFKLLAVILHMGNVSFEATILDNMESCDVTSSEHYTNAAKLLEVEKAALDVSLTQRSFMTNREQVSKPLSSEQAMDGKDAFVKSIYGRLFVWIFAKINHAIHKPQANGTNYTQKSIGLLDIFGFENFNTNSFEQLCINYANEQLQQFFVRHVFKLEQEEYAKEGISWKRIAFTDNQHTLDLLAIKPLNILALVDEESHFPKGTDATLLNKMNQLHEGSNLYIPSKSNQSFQFGIQHFAGMVSYDSKGFLEKNRDALSPDIIKLVEKSSNKLLRELFDAELRASAAKGPGSNGKIVITPKSSLRQVVDSRRQTSTLGYKFRLSLDSLMKALSVCQPFFIRCFKPNDNKISMAFDRELCAQQLRYSGMLETIRIRKSGYPIRHTFREFLTRYRVLLKSTDCDPSTETAAKCCEAICRAVITNEDDWRIGKTKIFLKDFHDSFLELERERALYRKATIIQRLFLGCKDRKTFLKKRRAAMVIQKHWRSYQSRREYRKLRQGFARLQSKIRSRQNHQQYQLRQAAVAVLQRQTRRYLARREWTRKREAVILLQAHTRGMLARKALEKMKMDAFLTAQEREAQRLAALDLQRRLEEVLSQSEKAAAESDDVSDEEMLENIFGFLPSMIGGQEGQAPEGFEDLERERIISVEEVDLGETRAEVNEPTEEEETLNKEEEEEAEEEDEFSFPKFAAMHFQGAVTHTHIQQRLRQPLLQHEDESDALACLTVWWIILRFMGDIPEPKQARSPVVVDSIQRKLGQRQARRLSSLVGLDQKLLRKKEKRKRADGTGKRRPSTIPEEITEETSAKSTMEVVKEEDDDILIGEGPTLDRPMTPLEKLHIIVGYAIVRQDIRDEIYCQICKQLVNNKNQKSSNRGWILLSICLGIFPPTNLLTDYLRSFLRHGPSEYASYCTERLQRTLANGEREEPPCWIELQAAETKKPMVVSVTLMDGRSISLHLDSASTSAEICKAVKQKIGLRDSFGFSVYIALNEKVWSLGSGGRHVLDAVSQCEQEERRQGREEQHTPWRLYVRKELFTPWHDCSTDPVSTDLIYRQVIRSLKSGEYQSDKEDDYVQLAAKHYFVQHGSTATVENARKVVQECINLTLIESKSETKLAQLVNTAHKQGAYITSNTSADAVKAEVVDYARLKWPIYFSTFFQVSKISGPPLLQDSFVIAVNWSGLSFQEGKERMFFEFSYLELTGIQILSKDKSRPTVGLSTLRGDFVLRVERAEDMVELVSMFLSGLRDRSLYAVALQDTSRQDDPAFLSCKKGDVLFLIKDGKYSAESGWITARNERTVQSGSVSSDVILVLPTLDRPTDEVLSLLNLKPVPKQVVQNGPPMEEFSIEKLAHFSLKEFSFEHFRQTGKDVGRNARPGKERLWANSREPLKYPLLKSLEGNSTLSYLACQAFTAILKYMGDYPVKQARSGVELTNQIFGPATQHPELQDEIYCQIMKQMTSNGNGLSLERGWQLLWLCCGLFPPSALLLQNVQRFLESRPREPLASGCLQRLRTMLSIEARKLPPHVVEVDAIQQNSSQIFHKVHFPNELAELFEVTTTTRIRDLCRDIANHFKLSSSDGYSLFVKTSNKIVSMNSKQYFFDSLRELTDTPKKAKKVKEGLPMTVPYLVLFMRKLWFNVIPGKDVTADLMFHFPQELPKYLRGYHNVTREEMISLAGLLFRVKVDTDKSQFIMINRMLKDLVPADQIRIMSAEDWKKHIVSSYNKQAGITVEEAMVAFLKGISRWQTFGCAFFEVKQTSDRKLPSNIMIAISKQGVSIINPKTKEVLVMQPFSKITAWSSGNTYFSISLGSMVKGNTLLCETSLGYKMEDLLSSYVDMYLNERQSVRPRNQLFSLKPVIMV